MDFWALFILLLATGSASVSSQAFKLGTCKSNACEQQVVPIIWSLS